MGIAELTGAIHQFCPHSHIAMYLFSAVSALCAVAAVYLRCVYTQSTKFLTPGWIARTAGWAAPVPIYVILMLAPLDDDLFTVLKSDEVIVALAGLYGLIETLKDIREAAAKAHVDKDKSTKR